MWQRSRRRWPHSQSVLPSEKDSYAEEDSDSSEDVVRQCAELYSFDYVESECMSEEEYNYVEEYSDLSNQDYKESGCINENPAEFTFAQLEAATKGFALEAKIGIGSSFATVYRGKLTDGRQVAIKRAESGHRARFQEQESAFQSEMAGYLFYNHSYLVGLVGYCNENQESLLVYEYMENGALSDHLHPKAPAPAPAAPSSPSPVVSSWRLRIKILLDASRGVEFLHSYAALPYIIYGNIKSSNILLDAGWAARVSDFNLTLMEPPEAQAHQTAAAGQEAGAGAVDPEYDDDGLRRRLTTKSDDVYGFGVVMLEVLTGKRAAAISEESDDGGSGSVSVVDYAVPSIVAGELGKVLDPRAPEPAAHEAEALGLVAYTALHCVVCLEGKGRPAMAAIVASLETALAICKGRSSGGDSGDSL